MPAGRGPSSRPELPRSEERSLPISLVGVVFICLPTVHNNNPIVLCFFQDIECSAARPEINRAKLQRHFLIKIFGMNSLLSVILFSLALILFATTSTLARSSVGHMDMLDKPRYQKGHKTEINKKPYYDVYDMLE